MSSYRPGDGGQRRRRQYSRSPSPPPVRPNVAAAALLRSAASNQTLNIDKFRPRSPTPERDPDIVAFLAAQEADKNAARLSGSGSTGRHRREREALTAEQNRVRRERQVGAAALSGAGHDGVDAPSSRLQASDSLSSLAGQATTKSRYQREKEEAERKAKEAEEAAARAYEEFTADMAGPGGWRTDPATSASSSSRSRTAQAPRFVSASKSGSGLVGESGPAPYVPSRTPASALSASSATAEYKTGSGSESRKESKPSFKRPLDMFGDASDDEADAMPVKSEPPVKKMRAMEDFLEQLQRDQKAREERLKDKVTEGTSLSSILAFEGQKQGSRDTGDPLTTNVCVLNLPANVSEDALGNFFAQWGDIGSVKIMWPRIDELGASGSAGAGMSMIRRLPTAGLTGFVCFMRRSDAELALKEADGITWAGSMIKTSWGKAMSVPARPQYYAPKRARRDRSKSPVGARRGRGDDADAALRKPRTARPQLRSMASDYGQGRQGGRSPSPRTKCRIKCERELPLEASNVHTVALRVQQHGPRFEALIREKEKDNPRFAFFFDEKSLLHQYYNVLIDPGFEPTLPPEPFTDEGDAAFYSSDSGEDSEAEALRKQRRDIIGPSALRRFTAMLRSLTPRRERIARCMVFALDHAHACDQVVDLLTQSLLIPTTPIPRKLARLYVLSDILHNSGNPLPNVWKYRMLLEKRLPDIFEHLGDVGRSFPSRMKAESWKQMVGHVLSAWESWSVFPSTVLDGLGAALLAPAAVGGAPTSVPATTTGQAPKRFQPPAGFDEEEDDDGEAIDPNAL